MCVILHKIIQQWFISGPRRDRGGALPGLLQGFPGHTELPVVRVRGQGRQLLRGQSGHPQQQLELATVCSVYSRNGCCIDICNLYQ